MSVGKLGYDPVSISTAINFPQYSILRKSLPPEILAPERVSFFFTQSSSLKSEPTIDTLPLVANPEIKPRSGDIIYVDNRESIPRSRNQKEDIKIIIEF